MLILVAFVLLLVICVIYNNVWKCKNDVEGFGGALVQLTAKSPMDSYLTFDTDKYVPEYYYPYNDFIWNNPTRTYRNSYWYPWNYLFPHTSYPHMSYPYTSYW